MFTLTDNQKLELIEKHLSNQLSSKEQQIFEGLLAREEDFALAVLFQKDLMPSIAVNGRKALKLQFQELEQEIAFNSTQKDPSALDKIKQKIEAEIQQLGYTIDQFIQLFAPVPNYTTAIAATIRGSQISVQSPKNEADCSEGFIYFDFGKPLQKDIEILIEDNQYDILIEEEISAGQSSVSLSLPISDFKAGRYYWKIIEGDELAMIRTFFIRKDLIMGLGVNF